MCIRDSYERALLILKEGLERHIGSRHLTEIKERVESALELKRAAEIEEKAASYAGEGKFAKAIKAWKQAGMISPESRTRNIEKIKWAKGQIRIRRVKRVVLLLILAVVGAGVFCALYPQRVVAYVNPFLKSLGINLVFLERLEPKGLDDIVLDENLTIEGIINFLERVKGKALSKKEMKITRDLRKLLVERFKEKRTILKFGRYLDLMEKALTVTGGTPEAEELVACKDEALGFFLDECRKVAAENVREGLEEMKTLLPYAQITPIEKELAQALAAAELQLRKEMSGGRIHLAEADLRRARVLEQKGDLKKALAGYKSILADYNDRALFGEVHIQAKKGIGRIEMYERKARRECSKAFHRIYIFQRRNIP